MEKDFSIKKPISDFFSESIQGLVPVLKSKFLYIGLASTILGIMLNFASQTYLHNYMSEGKTLPMLSDLILDNLPVIDLSLFYDSFGLLSIILLTVYVVHEKAYNQIPFILLVCGFFGSDTIFNGFSKYELGVYPSGHVGNIVTFLLLVKNKTYKWLLFICLVIVIITLFLSHGHYSIDILSGLFFSYAIWSFGNKYFTQFYLTEKRD
jgi:membrane-associated phospholipid phosphatase